MLDRNDLLLGRIAVEKSLLSPARLEEAVRILETRTPPPPLGAFLVAQGYLTGEQLLSVVDEHRRRLETAPAPLGSRYAVKGEIARGGMGIILDGTDLDLRRDLAIKVLPPPHDADPETRARFLEEAQVQGQLEHPNICPVHELGKGADGRPYFTMKKVKGRSLAQLFDSIRAGSAEREASLPRLLEIFAKVCDATAFAHSRGVIHRDLKPHNVMIGEFGEVLVMDWGLAKVTGRGASREASAVVSDRAEQGVQLSLDGSVVGTPAYMPPEQAEGRLEDIDPRSDIYSLGAILYEILTLRPPIEGANVTEVLDRAARGQIVPPSRRAPGRPIPADLEAAALKALARRPADRYPSVRELREDVAAFLEGRTLAAADYTPLQVAAKWIRRNRVFSTTAAVAALVLIAGTVVYVVNVTRARARAEEATGEARRETVRARAAESQATLRLAESLVAQGDSLGLAGRWGEARLKFGGAREEFLRAGASPLPAELGLQEAFRRSPPPLLTLTGSPIGLFGLAVSPDGRRALSTGEDSGLRLWDLATGREIRSLSGHQKPTWSAAFCPDGRRAVSGSWDGTLRLWDLDSGKSLGSFVGHGANVLGIALSPDGRRVASASFDRTVRTWDLETGRPLLTIPAHSAQAYDVAWSPDGRLLLSGGADHRVRLWDASTGSLLRDFPPHGRPVVCVRFSPDGRRALSAGWDHVVRVWNVDDGAEVCAFRGHSNTLWQAAFSPDGRTILSGGNDDTLRLWDAASGEELAALTGHADDVYAVAFLPDGRRALSCSYDKTLKLWDVSPESRSPVLARPGAEILGLALSADDRLAATAGRDGAIRLWDAATGHPLRGLPPHAGSATAVAFLPDGARALSAGADGLLRLVDLASGGELRRFPGHAGPVLALAVTDDGRRAVTGGEDKTLRIWDLDGGREHRTIRAHADAVHCVTIAPDGRSVLSGGLDFHLRLHDLETGTELRTAARGGAHGVYALAYLGGGPRVLVAAGRDPPLGIWDLAAGAAGPAFPGHTAAVSALALSRSGAIAVSGGADRTLRVWDVASRRELRSFSSPGPVRRAVVSSDGAWLLAACGPDLLRWTLGRPDDPALEARAASPDAPPDVLGDWHAFRENWAAAAAQYVAAAATGARVSPLRMGRCLWKAGDRAAALREFERARAEREAPESYLRLCIEALHAER